MVSGTLKNVPDDIHRALKARAKVHGRSLNREVLTTLEDTLHSSPIDAQAVGKHAQAVRDSLGVYLTQDDVTSMNWLF